MLRISLYIILSVLIKVLGLESLLGFDSGVFFSQYCYLPPGGDSHSIGLLICLQQSVTCSLTNTRQWRSSPSPSRPSPAGTPTPTPGMTTCTRRSTPSPRSWQVTEVILSDFTLLLQLTPTVGEKTLQLINRSMNLFSWSAKSQPELSQSERHQLIL